MTLKTLQRPLEKASDTLKRARHMLRAVVICHDQQEEGVDLGWATYEVLDMLARVQHDLDAEDSHQFKVAMLHGGAK